MNEAFHIYVHIYSRICTMTHLQMWYVYVTWLISRRDMWLSWKSSFIHVDVTRFHAQQADWHMRWSVSSYSRSHGVGWELRHRNLHTATLQHTATHCNTLQHTVAVCDGWDPRHRNLPYTETHCVRSYVWRWVSIHCHEQWTANYTVCAHIHCAQWTAT